MQSPNPANPGQVVLILQIITASMVMGILVFLGIAVVITQGQASKEPNLTYLALGGTALAAIASSAIRLPVPGDDLKSRGKDQSFDPRSDEAYAKIAPIYQTEHIIKLAVLEGAAFFAGVSYISEVIWWNLAAMGFLVALMLVRFPTHGRLEAWIERKTLGLQFGKEDF